ncbi:hypothetical protein AB3S75_042371 [Citrus x aurantiifolia]
MQMILKFVIQIETHVGGVNDIAFSHPDKQLCVITFGYDKTTKVWDATNGAKQYLMATRLLFLHCLGYIFIFSTALNGKIKA